MDAKTNRARRRARAVEVVEETTRVLRTDPGDRAALRRRLNAYVSLGWADAAERDATALLAANPDQAKLLAVRAKLRIALGRPADAERDVAALLVHDPRRALALYAAMALALRAPGSAFTPIISGLVMLITPNNTAIKLIQKVLLTKMLLLSMIVFSNL